MKHAKHTTRWMWCVGCVGAVTMTLALTGCASSDGGAQRVEDLPKLSEVRPRVQKKRQPPTSSLPTGPRVNALVEQLDVPLKQPLHEAWSMVDESVLPRVSRGVWQANGLRIGTLDSDEVDRFLNVLPRTLATHRRRIIGTKHPTPLRRTDRLRRAYTLDMTVPPRPVKEASVRGGELRLLARMSVGRMNQVQLDLLPHHFKREFSVRPRHPEKAALDGRIFNELGVSLDLTRDKVLVLGLHRDWPNEEDIKEAQQENQQEQRLAEMKQSADGDAQQDGDEEDESADNAPPPRPETIPQRFGEPPTLPYHLGRALMTMQRANQEAQVIMLISARPLNNRRRTASDADTPTP